MIRKPTLFDITLILFLAVVWGSAFLAIKVAVDDLGPSWLVTGRVVIGFLALLPYVLWKGWVLPQGARQWALIGVIATLNVIVPFYLISYAELTIDAGLTSLLMGTGPFLALIASHLTTDDDKLTRGKFLAVLLGFSAVLLVVGPAALSGAHADLLAQGAAMLGNVCYIVSGILIRKVEGIPPTRMAALVLAIASAALLAINLPGGVPDFAAVDTNALLCLVYLGLFPTGLAYILRYHLIRTVGFSFFALGLNLIPVFGVILAALLLGEAISWRTALALALVLAGLMIARRSARSA
ncbi:MAG: DMT family transporter [Hyphomicrobiaceae bacterium]|nr:DMT family transporter [Hyphomicrobiaceae bacterium]